MLNLKQLDRQFIQRMGSITGIALCLLCLYSITSLNGIPTKSLFSFLLLIVGAKSLQEWITATYKHPFLLFWGLCFLSIGFWSFWHLFETHRLSYSLGVAISIDSCAYIVGKLCGGPKLWPAISPHKTWSGACGALFLTTCLGCLCGYPVLGTALLGISAQIGDLSQSALKRHLGIKDMGACFPGHGGMLDRIDSWLMTSIICCLLC
jgi:CDP-diglyceride synthetase